MSNPHNLEDLKICILGLGYVGLPLAVEFGKKFKTLGYDINQERIKKLKSGIDDTLELEENEIKESKKLKFTTKIDNAINYNLYIITVPTPIDRYNKPNLELLTKATEKVGNLLKLNDIVIYESTVFPGATEEHCVPILEKKSGLKFNEEFFVGYSPERINPGDNQHKLTSIKKVVSGSTSEITEFIDKLYSSIILAGTYVAKSIKVAEAAKVIENTQRDLNIALMNELAIIFDKLDIDTESVLNTAATKWNFLNFKPGLVGGHCIGVDPYYLTHKAEAIGYHPQLILAGRRINDGMSSYVANKFIKKLLGKKIQVKNSKILVMGLTFKENCPDLRNTKVVDLIRELGEYGTFVDVYDPYCKPLEAKKEYGIILKKRLELNLYDGIIVCVAHTKFKELGVKYLRSLCKKNHVLFDLKHIFPVKLCDVRL